MFAPTRLKQLALVIAALAFAACASTDAPKKKRSKKKSSDDTAESDSSSSKRKKKKKKKKKKVVAEQSDEDSDDSSDEDKPKPKDDDGDRASREEQRLREEEAERKERRERQRKREKQEEEDERKRIADEKKAEAARKKEEAAAKKAEQLAAKKEAEEKKKAEAEAKKKKKKSSEEVDEDEDEEEDEAPRKKAKGKSSSDEDEDEDTKTSKKSKSKSEDEDDEDEEEDEAPKKLTAAQKKKAAAEEKKRVAAEKKAAAAEKKRIAAEEKKAAAEAKKAKKKAPVEDDEETEVVDKKAKKKAAEEDDIAIDMTDAEPKSETKPEPEPEIEIEEESTPIDFDKIEQEDDPLAGKRVAAIPVPGVDSDDGTDTGEPVAATTALSLIARPLTLPKGRAEFHGGLRIGAVTFPGADATMPDVKKTSQAFLLGGTYGVSDKIEVGADYTLSINPGQLKGPLTFRGSYSALSGKLDVAFAAALGVDFTETPTAMMMSTTTTSASLQLGAWVRYHVTPKLAIFTGTPALPNSALSLPTRLLSPTDAGLGRPLPPFQYQLLVGLSEAPSAIVLPVGVGFQATPAIYTFASLNLAHIGLTDGSTPSAKTSTAFLFADFIPITLGGFYSLKKADVGVVFSDDLSQGTGYLQLDFVLRYALK